MNIARNSHVTREDDDLVVREIQLFCVRGINEVWIFDFVFLVRYIIIGYSKQVTITGILKED
jgi:hypothetical protein